MTGIKGAFVRVDGDQASPSAIRYRDRIERARIRTMDGRIIPYNARILVADGKKALLLRNAGNAADLLLEVEQVLEAPDNVASHEQG
ncbi:hypothetical protein ACQZ4Q_21705 [Agrobacterium vitis]